MFCIDQLNPNDILQIEVLLDDCFGRNRHKKTAYRLRDDIPPLAELSFVVRIDGQVKASLQFWPVLIRGASSALDALLLGPIAVSRDCRGRGVGLKLMRHGLARARELGHKRVILVGDEAYYRKVGFCRDLARDLHMPGPVESERLLARELVPGAMKNAIGLISRIK